MLFQWTDEKLDWYVRASRASGFHARLADYIRPYLDGRDAVCDFGCGPGLLGLALAPDVREVTAVDISPEAIGFLARELREEGPGNLRAVCADAGEAAASLPAYDVALLCFFGGPGSLLKTIYDRAGRLTVCMMHGAETPGKPSKLSGFVHRKHAEEMAAFLEGEDIPFQKETLCLDFSQPLRSEGEARSFFEAYATAGDRTMTPAELESRLAQQLAWLEKAEDPEYPYLFPSTKEVAIFIIQNDVLSPSLTRQSG
ncbi:MAG: class I SAM-dependent methyltransferase [Clostridiales Family XIII bacterium]|jgi:SAM-dependent methyltransferase|nr:class I SAM-dependent methyltransferase [Clostridiales Family XIII bacterium]